MNKGLKKVFWNIDQCFRRPDWGVCGFFRIDLYASYSQATTLLIFLRPRGIFCGMVPVVIDVYKGVFRVSLKYGDPGLFCEFPAKAMMTHRGFFRVFEKLSGSGGFFAFGRERQPPINPDYPEVMRGESFDLWLACPSLWNIGVARNGWWLSYLYRLPTFYNFFL